MEEQKNTRKSQADVAHFYRALGRAGADGMVMPFEVHFYHGADYNIDSLMLRYRTVEEVDTAAAFIGARAGHDDYTHKGKHRTWHGYGTDSGGGNVDWSGWSVKVWAAVDGPAPEAVKP